MLIKKNCLQCKCLETFGENDAVLINVLEQHQGTRLNMIAISGLNFKNNKILRMKCTSTIASPKETLICVRDK